MSSSISIPELKKYVNNNIDDYHRKRADKLLKVEPDHLLKKNPYLHRALNLNNVPDLVNHLLASYLSSSDEGTFGGFLEGLAVYISQQVFGGQKGLTAGVDIDLTRDGGRYLIGVKSGPNWGNDDQWKKLGEHLDTAIRRSKQGNQKLVVEGVCGMCYGNKKHRKEWKHRRLYGQDFWELVSGDSEMYKRLILPIGYRAEEHNQIFLDEKNRVANQLTEFISNKFVSNGILDWELIVDYVSRTRA